MAESKIDDGGPAYPQHDLSAYGMGPSERGEHGDGPEDFGTRRYTMEGMSLRDYLAGQAIAGMMASQYVSDHAGMYKTDSGMVEGLALRSYQIADAMILARKAGV